MLLMAKYSCRIAVYLTAMLLNPSLELLLHYHAHIRGCGLQEMRRIKIFFKKKKKKAIQQY